jgi:hypothetical protein
MARTTRILPWLVFAIALPVLGGCYVEAGPPPPPAAVYVAPAPPPPYGYRATYTWHSYYRR